MSRKSKPKFLTEIEEKLQRELEGLKLTKQSRSEREEKRLDMFREAFKIVASELKTCGNLLERIREEYEVSLKRIAMELKHSEKEKKRLIKEFATLQQGLLEQVDLSGSAAASSGPVEPLLLGLPSDSGSSSRSAVALAQLRQQARLAHAQSKIERLEGDKRELGERICRAERKERDAQKRLEEEKDSRKLMLAEFLELQLTFNTFKEAQKEMEDPVVLRLALDQCRRDLSHCQFIINEYKYNKDFEMVPQSQLERLEAKHTKLSSDYEKMASVEKTMRLQNSELLLTVTELTQQLEMSRHVEKKGGGNSVRRRRGQSNDDDDFDTDADDSVVVDAEEEGVDDDEHDWENVEFGRKAGGGKRRTKIGRIKTVVEDVD